MWDQDQSRVRPLLHPGLAPTASHPVQSTIKKVDVKLSENH